MPLFTRDNETPEQRLMNEDWTKNNLDVPGGPHVQALTILQPNRGDPKENFKDFLKLPVSRHTSAATRDVLARMGYEWPAHRANEVGNG